MILCVSEADFEVEALRHRILEVVPLLSHLTADSGEGEDVAEEVGWVEGEVLEDRILEALRVISRVEGPCTTRWTRLTSGFNSGVSKEKSQHSYMLHL